MSTGNTEPTELLVERLAARDRVGALEVLRRLEASGAGPSELIEGLLAPTQRRVGALWQTDEWSIAQEHAATAIVDRLLADVARELDVVPTRPEVVVTCSEGEWHSMPARMFAELLRARGWIVTFLGGSVPAGDLGRFVRATRPHAVAISCTLPMLLPGAARSVAAVVEQGVAVLAGGAAFGDDARRARAIGAHAWAGSLDDAHAILEGWQHRAPAPARPPDVAPLLALQADRPVVVERAVAELTRRGPDGHGRPPCTRDGLTEALRCAEAAILVEDAGIFGDFVARHAQTPAQSDTSSLTTMLRVLHDVTPPAHAGARQLFAEGADRVEQG